jgi:hypothetical protein
VLAFATIFGDLGANARFAGAVKAAAEILEVNGLGAALRSSSR